MRRAFFLIGGFYLAVAAVRPARADEPSSGVRYAKVQTDFTYTPATPESIKKSEEEETRHAPETVRRAWENLAAVKKSRGADSPEAASAEVKVGEAYFHRGLYIWPPFLYKEALAILERAAPDSPALAEALGAQARVDVETRRFDDAEIRLERARKMVGARAGSLARAAVFLVTAELRRLQRRLPEAEEAAALALADYGRHPNEKAALARATAELGEIRRAQGRYADSEKILERARRLEAEARSDDLDQAELRAAFARTFIAEAAFDEAEKMLRQAETTQRTQLSLMNIRRAETLRVFGDLRLRQGRDAEADAAYRETMMILDDYDAAPAAQEIRRELTALHEKMGVADDTAAPNAYNMIVRPSPH